jgi:HEPN domain-containing protein
MSMTIKQHVDHWISSSNENMKDMTASIRSKRRANALYSGHQALEKILKGILAAQNEQIIYIHKIERLAELCGFALTDSNRLELARITGFYITTKYSSAKSKFRESCTPQFTAEQVAIIRKWYRLFKKHALNIRASLPNNTPALYPENTFR